MFTIRSSSDVGAVHVSGAITTLSEGTLQRGLEITLAHRSEVAGLQRPAGAGAVAWQCVRWNHNNQVMACSSDEGEIALVHESGKVLEMLKEAECGPGSRRVPVPSLAWGGRSRYLATTGGADRCPSLWDLKRKARVRAFRGHRAEVTTVAFSPDDTMVASGNARGEILMHQIKAEDALHVLASNPEPRPDQGGFNDIGGRMSQSSLHAVNFWPMRTSHLLGGYEDGTARVWDVTAGVCVATFHGQHKGAVKAVAGSPVNSKLIATAGPDRRLILFDVAQRKLLKECMAVAGVNDMVFHPEGGMIVAGCVNGDVVVYDLRRPAQPCHAVNAHHPLPVRSLSIQGPRKDKAPGVDSTKVRVPYPPQQPSKPTAQGGSPSSAERSTASFSSAHNVSIVPPHVPARAPPASNASSTESTRIASTSSCQSGESSAPASNGKSYKLSPSISVVARTPLTSLAAEKMSFRSDEQPSSIPPSLAQSRALSEGSFRWSNCGGAPSTASVIGEKASRSDSGAGGLTRSELEALMRDVTEDVVDGLHRSMQALHVEVLRQASLSNELLKTLDRHMSELVMENAALREEVKRLRSVSNLPFT